MQASALKKRLRHRRFPLNFAKFLRTPFLTEHPRWLQNIIAYWEESKQSMALSNKSVSFYTVNNWWVLGIATGKFWNLNPHLQYTNTDFKISLYVRIHVKILPWKFCIFNSKGFLSYSPVKFLKCLFTNIQKQENS